MHSILPRSNTSCEMTCHVAIALHTRNHAIFSELLLVLNTGIGSGLRQSLH